MTFIARTCFHAYRATHATRQDVGPTLSTGAKSQLGFCPVPLKWQFNQRGDRALMLSALLPHRKDAKKEKPLDTVILPTARACGKPDVEYSRQKC